MRGGAFPTLGIYKDVMGVERKRISARIRVLTLAGNDGDPHCLSDLPHHGGARLMSLLRACVSSRLRPPRDLVL